MNPFSLFQWDNEYLAVLKQVEEQDGVITDEQNALLNDMSRKLVESSDKYIGLMSLMNNAENQIDEWIEKWQKKKSALARERDRFKSAMVQHASALGVDSLPAEQGKVRIMESKSVVVSDASLLPQQFQRTKITVEPDKKAIKEAIESGQDVRGAAIETKKYPRIF